MSGCPNNLPVPINTPWWREALRELSLAHGHIHNNPGQHSNLECSVQGPSSLCKTHCIWLKKMNFYQGLTALERAQGYQKMLISSQSKFSSSVSSLKPFSLQNGCCFLIFSFTSHYFNDKVQNVSPCLNCSQHVSIAVSFPCDTSYLLQIVAVKDLVLVKVLTHRDRITNVL